MQILFLSSSARLPGIGIRGNDGEPVPRHGLIRIDIRILRILKLEELLTVLLIFIIISGIVRKDLVPQLQDPGSRLIDEIPVMAYI